MRKSLCFLLIISIGMILLVSCAVNKVEQIDKFIDKQIDKEDFDRKTQKLLHKEKIDLSLKMYLIDKLGDYKEKNELLVQLYEEFQGNIKLKQELLKSLAKQNNIHNLDIFVNILLQNDTANLSIAKNALINFGNPGLEIWKSKILSADQSFLNYSKQTIQKFKTNPSDVLFPYYLLNKDNNNLLELLTSIPLKTNQAIVNYRKANEFHSQEIKNLLDKISAQQSKVFMLALESDDKNANAISSEILIYWGEQILDTLSICYLNYNDIETKQRAIDVIKTIGSKKSQNILSTIVTTCSSAIEKKYALKAVVEITDHYPEIFNTFLKQLDISYDIKELFLTILKKDLNGVYNAIQNTDNDEIVICRLISNLMESKYDNNFPQKLADQIYPSAFIETKAFILQKLLNEQPNIYYNQIIEDALISRNSNFFNIAILYLNKDEYHFRKFIRNNFDDFSENSKLDILYIFANSQNLDDQNFLFNQYSKNFSNNQALTHILLSIINSFNNIDNKQIEFFTQYENFNGNSISQELRDKMVFLLKVLNLNQFHDKYEIMNLIKTCYQHCNLDNRIAILNWFGNNYNEELYNFFFSDFRENMNILERKVFVQNIEKFHLDIIEKLLAKSIFIGDNEDFQILSKIYKNQIANNDKYFYFCGVHYFLNDDLDKSKENFHKCKNYNVPEKDEMLNIISNISLEDSYIIKFKEENNHIPNNLIRIYKALYDSLIITNFKIEFGSQKYFNIEGLCAYKEKLQTQIEYVENQLSAYNNFIQPSQKDYEYLINDFGCKLIGVEKLSILNCGNIKFEYQDNRFIVVKLYIQNLSNQSNILYPDYYELSNGKNKVSTFYGMYHYLSFRRKEQKHRINFQPNEKKLIYLIYKIPYQYENISIYYTLEDRIKNRTKINIDLKSY